MQKQFLLYKKKRAVDWSVCNLDNDFLASETLLTEPFSELHHNCSAAKELTYYHAICGHACSLGNKKKEVSLEFTFQFI